MKCPSFFQILKFLSPKYSSFKIWKNEDFRTALKMYKVGEKNEFYKNYEKKQLKFKTI